jgi:hypothetical protein
VAEQAANYAYFFLAIGVLVQLEELALERCGWLERKLDLSHLWRPVEEAFRSCWSTALQAVSREPNATGHSRVAWWIQIVGTLGLAVAFLVAVFRRAPLPVVLSLLGGVVLFPFVVWVGKLGIRALKPVWLLRVILALVILPLAAAEMVWLHDLTSVDRLARMTTAYVFIDHLAEADLTSPTPDGETIEARMWNVADVSRRVLYQHPAFSGASRMAYQVGIGSSTTMLAFDVAMEPESWQMEGDGVAFAVYVESERGAEQVFSTYIDPKHNEADRCWHSYAVDLSAYAGQTVTLIFETRTGPAGNYEYDWAAWAEPRLLEGR